MKNKIISFDNYSMSEFKESLQKDLFKLEEKYGMSFCIGRIDFNQTHFELALKGVLNDKNGKSNQFREEFKEYHQFYGFKEVDLGRDFTLGGKDFKVFGLKTNIQSNRLIGEEVSTKKLFFLPEEKVLEKLHPNAKPVKLSKTPKQLLEIECKAKAKKDKEAKKILKKQIEDQERLKRIKKNQLAHELKTKSMI